MTRRRRLFLILTAIAAVAIGVAAACAWSSFPGWARGRIERAAGEALGRELRIAGPFELSLSLSPRLVAGDVALANAPWGSEPSMVRIAHVTASIDLASLWTPPLRIRDVEIDGVRVVLERDTDGRGNWEFAKPPSAAPRPAREASSGPPFLFDRAAVRGLELSYRARRDAPPVRLGVARFETRLEPATGAITLDAAGHINDAPWDVAGRLGTFDNLYRLRDAEPDLTGHYGDATLAIRGRLGDPLTLGDPDLEMEVEGADIVAALATFGLSSPLTGPFHLRSRVAPAREAVDLDLAAEVAGVKAAARGRVDSLLKPGPIDATVEASGPDAAIVGRWVRVKGLPPRPFEVAGRVRLDGRRLSFDAVKVRVGGTSAVVSGPLGALPRCVGTDLAVTGSGRDMSELSALTRLRLPTGAFTVRGRFLRRKDALAVADVDIRLKDTVVRGGGTIGEPPRLAALDLSVDASGPDLSLLSGIAKVELPGEPFALRGRIARRGAAYELDGIEGRLGSESVRLDGSLVDAPRLAGSELHGRIAGPDLARAASLVGLHGLPAEPYDIAGRVRFAPDGYRLDDVEARAGRLIAKADGELGARPAEDGTTLDLHVRGPALSDLGAWGAPAGLPADPFAASGQLSIEAGVFRVGLGTLEVGADHATLDGTLGRLPDLSPLNAEVAVSGPDLASLGRFFTVAGREPPQHIPAEPYAVSGRIVRVPSGFELHGARGTVGRAEFRLDGTLGSGERLLGTDLRVEARAPDASLAASLGGVKLPAGPVELHGRLERVDAGIRLENFTLSIGDARAEISGIIGRLPKLAGTAVDLRVAGQDLADTLGPVTGLTALPARPFEVSAHVEGSIERFASTGLTARLGENDAEGSVSVRLEGRPFVEADLRSKHLGTPKPPDGFLGTPAPAPVPAKPGNAKPRGLLIPDEPLELDALRALDAKVRMTAAELAIPGLPIRNAVIDGELRDGALRLDRVEGTGEKGGRVTASLVVEPVDGGYRLRAEGNVVGGKLRLVNADAAPEQDPSFDAEFSLEGVGRSLHAIAADGNGHVLISVGPGRLPGNLTDFLTEGIFRALLDALNPFRKSSAEIALECGVAAASLADGHATVAPIAMRTDRLTVIGNGTIDLSTEAISLGWTLKPRRGIGITAGSIASPYIKLGGTLSSPALDLNPIDAMATTGMAVATAGLWTVAQGFYNRITAERNVCVKALAEARKQVGGRATREGR